MRRLIDVSALDKVFLMENEDNPNWTAERVQRLIAMTPTVDFGFSELIDSKPIVKKAIETYGEEKQYKKFMEEVGELLVAVGKGTNRDNIAEEIADVHIMLDQIAIMNSVSTYDIRNWQNRKIFRLAQNLEGVE